MCFSAFANGRKTEKLIEEVDNSPDKIQEEVFTVADMTAIIIPDIFFAAKVTGFVGIFVDMIILIKFFFFVA